MPLVFSVSAPQAKTPKLAAITSPLKEPHVSVKVVKSDGRASRVLMNFTKIRLEILIAREDFKATNEYVLNQKEKD